MATAGFHLPFSLSSPAPNRPHQTPWLLWNGKLVVVLRQVALGGVGRCTVAEGVSVFCAAMFHSARSGLLSPDPMRRSGARGPPACRWRRCSLGFTDTDDLHVVGWNSCEKTESAVSGELLVDLPHPLDVQTAGLGVVHHGFGVIHADHTFGGALHLLRCVPGVIDELGWKISEYR